ncbi:MAG: acetylornithine transaminase [Actinomycetota bacterium]|nr:acetylornithine transaminase [Actinomycetota bacterium]
MTVAGNTVEGNTRLVDRWVAAALPTYPTPPLALVRGAGAHVWDADGVEYVDLLAGIAVGVLGHAHPAVVAAVCRQVATLGHVSNLFVNEPAVILAERLRDLTGAADARVFFANSGAEANETALKLVRRARPDRRRIVAAEGSFHGRTLGALSLTGQPAKRAPFEPLPGPVDFVPYGDAGALRAAVTPATAAVFLEPVQGEAGVLPAPAGYLESAREACAATGALLVLDEVQGGIGRAGGWFSHQVIAPAVRPDVITLAKGLGGGLPIGACIALGEAAGALRPGDHGSTFGGNPICCAAALAVLDTLATDGLLARSAGAGNRLATDITGLGHPLVTGVRGLGLWRAVQLRRQVAGVAQRALRGRGFLVDAVRPDALRLAPPLVISDGDLAAFVAALGPALDASATIVPTSAVPAGKET